MTLADLITAKAIQSKKDGRMATFLGLENDLVVLEMEQLGTRKFHRDIVEQGFIAHLDNMSLVKGWVARQLGRTDVPCDDTMVWKLSCQTYDFMSRRFPTLTNVECYTAIRELLPINNEQE